MDIHVEIDPAALEALGRAMHPAMECPFCPEWRLCATCNSVEQLALAWHVHVITKHWEEIEAASAAHLADPLKGADDYYEVKIKKIYADRIAAEKAAAEQETTETADASGD